MDTKYFQQALEETIASMGIGEIKVGELTLQQLSLILRRAQSLKNKKGGTPDDQRTI
jgi:hypothetical protein